MSRSIKRIPIVKDHHGRLYNRVIRRAQKIDVKKIMTLADIMSYNISTPYEIIHQDEVCDWKIYCPKHFDNKYVNKIKRK